MDRSWSLLAVSLAFLGWGGVVSSQQPSLAEIARQEKERRAAIVDPAPVYTNDDLAREGRGRPAAPRLRTTRRRPAVRPPVAPDPRDLSGTSSVDDVDHPENYSSRALTHGEPARNESYWRDRLFTAREARRRADVVAAALQNRVDGLWAEFTARDDPAQRSLIEQQRYDAIDWLERTRATLLRLDEDIADIHEEARQAGAPPGWLRD